jgi:hypothetical protein
MKNAYQFRVTYVKGRTFRPAWQMVAGARATNRRYMQRSSFAKKAWDHRRTTAGRYRYWRGLFQPQP